MMGSWFREEAFEIALKGLFIPLMARPEAVVLWCDSCCGVWVNVAPDGLVFMLVSWVRTKLVVLWERGVLDAVSFMVFDAGFPIERH